MKGSMCYEEMEVHEVMSNKVPSDGIIVKNARLAVSTELQRINLLPNLTRKPVEFIWRTVMAP